MEKILAEANINSALLLILAIIWALNMIFQFVQNGKRATNEAKEPFKRIDGTITEMRSKCEMHVKDLDSRIDTIERRLIEHDEAIRDLHAGQSAICRGVQALLDGNEEEMKAASKEIGEWLRTR